MNAIHTLSKGWLLIATFLIAMFGAQDVSAQQGKERAKTLLQKNIPVLQAARKAVMKGKNYTGDFASACAHQRYAHKMYNRGRYMLAIHHGRRARMLAIEAIKANKGKAKKGWEFSKSETSGESMPSDGELDDALPEETFTDEQELSAPLDLEDLDDRN